MRAYVLHYFYTTRIGYASIISTPRQGARWYHISTKKWWHYNIEGKWSKVKK